MPGVLDHVLAAVLAVVWPLYVARSGREEMRALAEQPWRRRSAYRSTIAAQWTFSALIVGVWWHARRAWSELGLGFAFGWGFAVGLVLAALAVWAMWSQWVRVQRDPELAAQLREQVHGLEGLLPVTRRELATFRAVALTAGVCEELAYRGFLLWYFGTYVPLALAIPLTMIAFGGAHLYQGAKAASQTALIGGAAALLYVLSGSLWIPMALHTLFDLNQLAVVRAARRQTTQGARPAGG